MSCRFDSVLSSAHHINIAFDIDPLTWPRKHQFQISVFDGYLCALGQRNMPNRVRWQRGE